MTAIRIVGVSGSTRRPSRTRTLIEAVAAEVAKQRDIALEIFDISDAGPGLGAFSRSALPKEAENILQAIEGADALIVGSPVYKGSYTGLFKHLFDFIDPAALVGKPVVLTATGGGYRHALIVEHQLRPLFGFFSALTIPTAVYGSDGDFQDGEVVSTDLLIRIKAAATELHHLAPAAAARAAAAVA